MYAVHLENKKVSRYFFLFLWLTYAIVYMTKNCFSAALASIVAEGVMTKSQTGLITSVFYLIYAPLQVVGGIFADKYNPESLIKIGLWGSGFANLVIFLNQNYYVMLVVWAFNAIVQFAVWPAVFKIVSSQLVKDDRKPAAFYITLSSSAGLILAYFAAAFIKKWQYNFLVSGTLLIVLGICMHFVCKKVDRYLIDDKPTAVRKTVDAGKDGFPSTSKMFLKSGFYIVVVVAFLRILVELGSKTFAPTMLMESYQNISPSAGNLINILIISMGMVGTLLVKTVLYPKYIKSELGGMLDTVAVSLPFCFLLIYIGDIPAIFSVISLCIIVCTLNATNLFASYHNMYFAKYGKSGVAAGLVNAAASLSIVVQSYGIGKIADVFSWKTVSIMFTLSVTVATVLAFIAIPVWNRFKRKTY